MRCFLGSLCPCTSVSDDAGGLTGASARQLIPLADESYHVCHPGYISLFPLLLGLLPPDSPHLGAMLDLLRDPEQVWSDYGIRSLSKASPFFGQGEKRVDALDGPD